MRKKIEAEVEVPVVPMLDMSFQLLFFFIATYNPAPQENQFQMSLMPATPQTKAAGAGSSSESLPIEVQTIPIDLFSDDAGSLVAVQVAEDRYDGPDRLEQLRAKIKQDFLAEEGAFDQVALRIDPRLLWAGTIQVVDVLSSLELTKISFAQLAE